MDLLERLGPREQLPVVAVNRGCVTEQHAVRTHARESVESLALHVGHAPRLIGRAHVHDQDVIRKPLQALQPSIIEQYAVRVDRKEKVGVILDQVLQLGEERRLAADERDTPYPQALAFGKGLVDELAR
jgi:hypothetical protein